MDSGLDDYLLDRLADCGLPARYYAWVDALAAETRGLPLDIGDDYTLTGEDMAAGWAAAGLRVTGSRKSRTGTLHHGDVVLSSMLLSPRGSNFLSVTVNLKRGPQLAGSELAVLSARLRSRVGEPPLDPPYPRPSALAAGDVIWYAARIGELLRDVAGACDRVPPPDV